MFGIIHFSQVQAPDIEEALIIHYSHLDIGYTHLQPIALELQNDYLDEALDMLGRTAHWPELSMPKWTCEVTAPVLNWLKTARAEDIERFKKYLDEGRIGILAMEYH